MSKFEFGKGCTVGAFSVIDISDCPKSDQSDAKFTLGDYVYIGEQCNLRASGSHINVGNGTMIANNVVIVSTNHITTYGVPIFQQSWDFNKAGVMIGADCWIGSNCVILPGSVIGDGAIIAAGAVVRGKVPPNTVWGGVPAKYIKDRI